MKAIVGSVFPPSGDVQEVVVIRDDTTYIVDVSDDEAEAEAWLDAAAENIGGGAGWVIPDLSDAPIVYVDPS